MPQELESAIPEVLKGWGEAFNAAVNAIESVVPQAECGGIQSILSGLQPGNNANVFVVDSDAELEELFEQLSAGGSPVQSTYPGEMVELADGTRVGFRSTSLTGGATIDINQPGSPIVKIHIGP